MNEQQWWQWTTHGLGGVLKILQDLSDEGPPASEHYLSVMKDCKARLDLIIEQQEAKTR